MKKRIIFPLIALLALATACGSSQSDGEMTYHDPTNFFEPADTATDSTSILRRKFFADHGSYLLFNDTLQHSFLGYDTNGELEYFTETVDVNYTLGSHANSRIIYHYNYFNSYAEYKELVNYLEKFILVHFSTKLRPFSWLLVKNISYTLVGHSNTVKSYAASGQRCIALGCDALPTLNTDAKKQMLAKRQLSVIVGNLANNNTNAFDGFGAVSMNYYGTLAEDLNNTTECAKQHGFISVSKTMPGYMPDFSADLAAFASLVINYDENQLQKYYGNYPLIIKKYYIVRQVLTNLGYVF